jgi:hypothetical protein
MFSDGETLDVYAARDDSTLRAWAFRHHYGYDTGSKTKNKDGDDRIEGVASLGVAYTYTPEVGSEDP